MPSAWPLEPTAIALILRSYLPAMEAPYYVKGPATRALEYCASALVNQFSLA